MLTTSNEIFKQLVLTKETNVKKKIVKDLPVAAASAEGNVSMSWTISPVELRATLPMIIVTEQKMKNWQQ